MALYDGFFDSFLDEETQEYDRAYSSGDFTEYFNQLVGSGVCIHNDPDSFLARLEDGAVVLSPGYLFIQGYWLKNDSDLTVPLTGTAASAIVAHLNKGKKKIEVEARSVSQSYPDALVLCLVDPSAGTIVDTRYDTDICGVIDSAGGLSNKVQYAINYIDTQVDSKLAQIEAEVRAQEDVLDEKIAEVESVVDQIAPPPIGAIKFSAAQDMGAAWLKCDGRIIKKSDYPALVPLLLDTSEADMEETAPAVSWEKMTLPSGNWISAAYGNGRYVAVSFGSSQAIYSSDGVSWQTSTLPYQNWIGVAYGAGRFVAVAQNSNSSKAAYSLDGITWTQSTIQNLSWLDIAYGNGLFMALCPVAVSYSFDGITWRTVNLPHGNFAAIAYGAGKFVVVSGSNYSTFAYSADGSVWQETPMPFSADWSKVLYDGNKFFAFANNTDRIAYSEDGVIWKHYMLPGAVWAKTKYVGGKYFALTGGEKGAISTDGLSWNSVSLPKNGLWRDVDHGAGKFVAVQAGGCTAAYSEDGVQWEEHVIPIPGNWTAITYGDGKFVALDGRKTAACSVDGTNWTMSNLPFSGYWRSIAYGNGKFVAIASDKTQFAYSTDGLTWESGTFPENRTYTCIVYGNGMFGVFGSNNYNMLFAYSPDGITWSQGNVSGGNRTWYGAAYGNNRYVVVAPTLSNTYYFFISKDSNIAGGFIASSTIPSGSWRSIAYGGGRFVALEWNGSKAIYSEDGRTWTQSTLPQSGFWKGIAYGDGKFIAVGPSGKFAVSPDGATWSAVNVTGTADAIAYGGGRFVAPNPNSMTALYSDDGQTWESDSTMSGTGNCIGVSYGEDRFVAIVTNTSGNSYFGAAYSMDGKHWTSVDLTNISESIYQWGLMAYGNGKFVVVSSAQSALYSTDGITWTKTSLPESGVRDCLIFGGGRFVLASDGGCCYSEDGIIWTKSDQFPIRAHGLAYGGGKYIAVPSTSGNYALSADGVTWSTYLTPLNSLSFWQVAYGQKGFVFASSDGHTAVSEDGVTLRVPIITIISGLNSLIWAGTASGGGILIAVKSSSAESFYSEDGIFWESATLPLTTSSKAGCVYGAGRFVIGSDGTAGAYTDPFTSVKLPVLSMSGIPAYIKAEEDMPS